MSPPTATVLASCLAIACILTCTAADSAASTDSTRVVPFYVTKEESYFYGLAKRHFTDKVMLHHYETLYSKYFEPIGFERRLQPLKVLEIGLGCDMTYGPGHSALLWREYFPNAELWMADFDVQCVQHHREALDKLKIQTVTGDQAQLDVLDRWVQETGGKFDVIIDDGGHSNMQQFNTFAVLFDKALKPGGIFFIEDLQAARWGPYVDGDGNHVMIEVLKDWLEGLVMSTASIKEQDVYGTSDQGFKGQNQYLQHMRLAGSVPFLPQYKMPPRMKEMDCSDEMCAFLKCRLEDDRCPLGLPVGPAVGQDKTLCGRQVVAEARVSNTIWGRSGGAEVVQQPLPLARPRRRRRRSRHTGEGAAPGGGGGRTRIRKRKAREDVISDYMEGGSGGTSSDATATATATTGATAYKVSDQEIGAIGGDAVELKTQQNPFAGSIGGGATGGEAAGSIGGGATGGAAAGTTTAVTTGPLQGAEAAAAGTTAAVAPTGTGSSSIVVAPIVASSSGTAAVAQADKVTGTGAPVRRKKRRRRRKAGPPGAVLPAATLPATLTSTTTATADTVAAAGQAAAQTATAAVAVATTLPAVTTTLPQQQAASTAGTADPAAGAHSGTAAAGRTGAAAVTTAAATATSTQVVDPDAEQDDWYEQGAKNVDSNGAIARRALRTTRGLPNEAVGHARTRTRRLLRTSAV